MVIKRGAFAGMTRADVDVLLKREDCKKFLSDIRACKGAVQTRGVQGTEILVPDVYIGILRDNMHRYSKLYSAVNVNKCSGRGRKKIVGTIPEAVWMESTGSTLNELAFAFHGFEINDYKVGGFIAIENSDLEDIEGSGFNIVSEILDKLGQSIGFALDKAILYGNRNKMPMGIVPFLALSSKPDWWENERPAFKALNTTNIIKFTATEAALSDAKFFAVLVEKLGVVKSNYSDGVLKWAMSTKTYNRILSKAVTITSAGAITAQINNTLPIVGGTVDKFDFMADGDIVGGYMSLYTLAEHRATTLEPSTQVRFLEDQTVFKATARYDGVPAIGEGFVAVNIFGNDVTTAMSFAPDAANTVSESSVEGDTSA